MLDEYLCKLIHKRHIKVRDVLYKVIEELSGVGWLVLGGLSFVAVSGAVFLTIGDIYYLLKGYPLDEILTDVGLLKVATAGFIITVIPILALLVIYAAYKSFNKVLDIEIAQCPALEEKESSNDDEPGIEYNGL